MLPQVIFPGYIEPCRANEQRQATPVVGTSDSSQAPWLNYLQATAEAFVFEVADALNNCNSIFFSD